VPSGKLHRGVSSPTSKCCSDFYCHTAAPRRSCTVRGCQGPHREVTPSPRQTPVRAVGECEAGGEGARTPQAQHAAGRTHRSRNAAVFYRALCWWRIITTAPRIEERGSPAQAPPRLQPCLLAESGRCCNSLCNCTTGRRGGLGRGSRPEPEITVREIKRSCCMVLNG